jgi:hypothetical protein
LPTTQPNYTPGKGTVLKLGSTVIAETVSISGPNRTVGSEETTTLGLGVKTFRPTITDNGEISIDIRYFLSDASHIALEALLVNPENENWTLVFQSGYSYEFVGHLTAFDTGSMEVETSIVASLTIKISGDITKVDPEEV